MAVFISVLGRRSPNRSGRTFRYPVHKSYVITNQRLTQLLQINLQWGRRPLTACLFLGFYSQPYLCFHSYPSQYSPLSLSLYPSLLFLCLSFCHPHSLHLSQSFPLFLIPHLSLTSLLILPCSNSLLLGLTLWLTQNPSSPMLCFPHKFLYPLSHGVLVFPRPRSAASQGMIKVSWMYNAMSKCGL